MVTTPVSSGATNNGFTVASGNTLDVLNGGTAASGTVQAGGIEIVEIGGIDSGSTILAGGTQSAFGNEVGDQIYGTQLVSAPSTVTASVATVSNETVYNGGVVTLGLKGAVATNTTVLAGGTLNLNGSVVASNTTLSGAVLDLQSPKATLSGSLVLAGANTIYVDASQSPTSTGTVGDHAVISGFVGGDVIDDRVITSGATVALTSAANGANTTVNITSGGTVVESFIFAGTNVSALALAADANGFTEIVACYCPGTAIQTASGEVAVEALAVGDLVETVEGALEPVRWIGRRSYTGRTLAGRSHLQPVRIKAGALADGIPVRDLVVSPLHAMLIDGLLVPAHALVNGTTVVRDACSEVHYIHFELAQHTAIWAEGAASETFVDDDSRFLFQSSEGEAVTQPGCAATYYAPRVQDGFALEAIRRRLAARAASLTLA